jgi:hypothetical protein
MNLGLIDEEVGPTEEHFPHPPPDRGEFACSTSRPPGNDITIDLDPLPSHGLNLGVDRRVVSMLGNQDLRH